MGIKMTAKKRKEERDKKVYVGGRPYIWMVIKALMKTCVAEVYNMN